MIEQDLGEHAARRVADDDRGLLPLFYDGSYVLEFFERDELRSRDLARRTPRLVVEVDISGPYIDEASDLPRPQVFGDRAFS
jgi:hypothetical protein